MWRVRSFSISPSPPMISKKSIFSISWGEKVVSDEESNLNRLCGTSIRVVVLGYSGDRMDWLCGSPVYNSSSGV